MMFSKVTVISIPSMPESDDDEVAMVSEVGSGSHVQDFNRPVVSDAVAVAGAVAASPAPLVVVTPRSKSPRSWVASVRA